MTIISFRIDDALKDKLDACTQRHNLTSSAFLRSAIESKIAELDSPFENHKQPPKLSVAERMILRNQNRILAILNENKEPFSDYYADVFNNGYSQHYEQLRQELSVEQCVTVLRILLMFSDMKIVLAQSTKSKDLKFIPGFDVKTELKEYHYVQFLLKYRGVHSFSSLARILNESDFVSAAQSMLPTYLKMLLVWESFKAEAQSLTLKQVKILLKELNVKV